MNVALHDLIDRGAAMSGPTQSEKRELICHMADGFGAWVQAGGPVAR